MAADADECVLDIDDLIDSAGTLPVSVPPHLDEATLAFLARIQQEANERVRDAEARAERAASDAAHETAERIAADIERRGRGRSVLVGSHEVAERVRSLAWASHT